MGNAVYAVWFGIPAALVALWLWAELKGRSRGFRITVAMLAFAFLFFLVFGQIHMAGYDAYHQHFALQRMRVLLDQGDVATVTNALHSYEQARTDRSRSSGSPIMRMRDALGEE